MSKLQKLHTMLQWNASVIVLKLVHYKSNWIIKLEIKKGSPRGGLFWSVLFYVMNKNQLLSQKQLRKIYIVFLLYRIAIFYFFPLYNLN